MSRARGQDGRARAAGPPVPTSCRGQGCTATVVFLASAATPGRFICANLKGERRFVMVKRDDPLVLADQADIDAGDAVARNVLTYSSHHAPYPAVPACPAAAELSRRRDHARQRPAKQ